MKLNAKNRLAVFMFAIYASGASSIEFTKDTKIPSNKNEADIVHISSTIYTTEGCYYNATYYNRDLDLINNVSQKNIKYRHVEDIVAKHVENVQHSHPADTVIKHVKGKKFTCEFRIKAKVCYVSSVANHAAYGEQTEVTGFAHINYGYWLLNTSALFIDHNPLTYGTKFICTLN